MSRNPAPIAISAALALFVACQASPPQPATDPSVVADSTPTMAASPPTRYPAAQRVIAMGDLHGDMPAFQTALKLGGLIDAAGHWAGGQTVVVQTGDVLDRGDDERAILELITRLEAEAAEAGGRFISLNGNHETMNVAGDLRYVTPGGFSAFADVQVDATDPRFAGVPAEARGRLAAFSPGGPWASQLAARNAVAIVGDTVYVHGGVLPDAARRGIDAFNTALRAWMSGAGAPPPEVVDPDGPLWSRHYSDSPDAADCAALKEALELLGATRMVVGHTVQEGGISPACAGAVWRVDVGMAAYYGGQPAVLELTPTGLTSLTQQGPHPW